MLGSKLFGYNLSRSPERRHEGFEPDHRLKSLGQWSSAIETNAQYQRGFQTMRMIAVAVSLILLSGCNQSPNIDVVAASAKAQFQRQLNQDFADEQATVQKVSLVQTRPPKYEGEAIIAAYNSTFTVPLVITSDGKTTLVTADSQKLASGFESALQHDLAILAGKYSDYILSPTMFELMPASLKGAKADFSARLGVISPIDSDGRYYFGSGCAPHECTMNEAAWVIDKITGKSAAVIMKYIPDTPVIASHENFQLYGATMGNLPPPLASWANQQGMTEMNVVSDIPVYQAPQK
jgi:outer membrane murein-binding lipoprotein Lpp